MAGGFLRLRSSQVYARPPRRSRRRFSPQGLPQEQLEERAVPAVVTLTVGSLADSGAGTLRQAITTADQGAASNSYVINIVTPGTVTLESVLPDLSRNITINGLGASTSTVQRDLSASSFRIFKVDAGETVDISGLTIARGNAGNGSGGGLDNFGTLTVSNSVFSSDSAGFGGGLFSDGTATVSGSTFTSNSATFGGGLDSDGTATVSGSTFTSNSASFGGGLANESRATATVSGSSFTRNSASVDGGGIKNFGTLTQSGNTFTGNIPNNVS